MHTVPAGGAGCFLEVLADGKVIGRVKEKPYYVQQGPGYALGYEIVAFDRRLAAGKTPSFSAYELDLPARRSRLQLHLVDGEGKVLPGSLRQVRPVRQPEILLLAGIALLPLAAGAAFTGRRARRTGGRRWRNLQEM